MTERKASCACGGLTVTARGEPVHVYACSCVDCQRTTGTAFYYGAVFPNADVTIAGEHRLWRHYGDSGRWQDNGFCVTCGATVFARGEAFPDVIGISAGCFADPSFPAPSVVYWASRRHAWLGFPPEAKLQLTQPS